MTPNYDHGTLFLAPPPPAGTEADGGPHPAFDEGAEAMRRLRHPFAVPQSPPAGTARASFAA
jgi:hypothetical protein